MAEGSKTRSHVALGLALPSSPGVRVGFAALIALFGAVLLGGCPGELESPDKFKTDGGGASGTCFDIPNDLFKKQCNGAGCHEGGNAPANPPNLDLTSPGVEGRLVGKPGSSMCPGILVDPKNAEGSILYKKLTPQFCGTSKMPLAKTPLNAAELACVKEWIESLEGGGGSGPGAGGMGGMGVGGAGGMGGAMGGAGGN